MIDFLLGALTGILIMMIFLNLVTSKAITLRGYTKKSEDPRLFRNLTLAYLAGFLGSVVLLVFL